MFGLYTEKQLRRIVNNLFEKVLNEYNCKIDELSLKNTKLSNENKLLLSKIEELNKMPPKTIIKYIKKD